VSWRGRLGRRFAEQIALPELDPERAQFGEIRASFDPLRQEPRADAPAERDEGLDERLFRIVVADPVDDVAVDLDDGRPERGDQREARVASAGVVRTVAVRRKRS